MEAGVVTLLKIVGTLLASISAIPLLFLLLSGGDASEPKGDLGELEE